MKHTIQGKHGHHIRMSLADLKSGKKGLFTKSLVCVSASEAAHSDFMSMEIELREKLSLKWNVCMWCWRPGPGDVMSGFRNGKKFRIGLACSPGKCSAWTKVSKNNYRLKNGA